MQPYTYHQMVDLVRYHHQTLYQDAIRRERLPPPADDGETAPPPAPRLRTLLNATRVRHSPAPSTLPSRQWRR